MEDCLFARVNLILFTVLNLSALKFMLTTENEILFFFSFSIRNKRNIIDGKKCYIVYLLK